MKLMHAAERLMGMSDEVWLRHANPLSVWTRFSCLPVLVLAIWSRDWFGAGATIPIALALAWIWYNPRAFAPPVSWDNWASKGTLGERVYLRHRDNVADHHVRAATTLAGASAIGIPPLIYGLWVFDLGWTLLGLVGTILPKFWFVDRMVWIWQDFEQSGGTRDALLTGEEPQ